MNVRIRDKQHRHDDDLSCLIPMSVAMTEFGDFVESLLGQTLLELERTRLMRTMSSLVGYNCLQLSISKRLCLSDAGAMGHYIKMGYAPDLRASEDANRSATQDNFLGNYQSFPVAHDCIDMVILHHVMEFANEPIQLLREADRTLTQGGHLLIVGFNPLSIWPLFQRYLFWKMHTPFSAGFAQCRRVFNTIRQGRLSDWLAVLNYDVLEEHTMFFRPPVNHRGLLRKTCFLDNYGSKFNMPFGMVYLTVARKRATPLNPITNRWRKTFVPKPVSLHRKDQTLNRI